MRISNFLLFFAKILNIKHKIMNNFLHRVLQYLKSLISFSGELDYDNATTSIRKNIAFRGTNVFILACAIIIASVGLNVNSIPVIIGAMLVSPVMGPILGFGLGVGTEDNKLVKDSLKNYCVMVGISIIASSLFFLLSPLSLANPSELLARTRPSIYDVLIALFGGLAGIIEISRKDKGTVISGVAIATALMPPLCTVGYGLSIWNWHYIAGALYLFLINSIFISLATFLAVKFFRFPIVKSNDETRSHLSRRWVYFILLIVIAPSIISAVNIVKENNFMIHAEYVVSENKSVGKCFIYDYKASYSRKSATLELFLAGESLTPEAKQQIYQSAEDYGIRRDQIIFHEDATTMPDDISETEIIKSIYEHSDRQIKQLSDSIVELGQLLTDYKAKELPVEAVSKELFAQYPTVKSFSLTQGSVIDAESQTPTKQITAVITTTEPLDAEQKDRITRWLKVRLNNENVLLMNEIEAPTNDTIK